MIDSPSKLILVPDAGESSGDGDAPVAPLSSATDARAATRVHVDQDGSGAFVYRLVDVITGRVLVELPRERAGELKDVHGDAAGVLLSA